MSTCKRQVVSPCTEKHLCNEVPKRPAGKFSPSSRTSQSTLKKRDLAPRLTSEDLLTSKFPNLLYRVLVHCHSARHPWGPFVYLTHTSRWVTLKRQTKIKEATEGENDIILNFPELHSGSTKAPSKWILLTTILTLTISKDKLPPPYGSTISCDTSHWISVQCLKVAINGIRTIKSKLQSWGRHSMHPLTWISSTFRVFLFHTPPYKLFIRFALTGS